MGRSAFQPTRPYGARHPARLPMRVLQPRVSTHAPLWGATALRLPVVGQLVVSTHAPLWGATCGRSSASLGRAKFQPTRPYGARPSSSQTRSRCALFQPTRPYGARRRSRFLGQNPYLVSTHAPLWGATNWHWAKGSSLRVSTHAPLWGATDVRHPELARRLVSTHAPLWGATTPACQPRQAGSCFNPRAPMGRDQQAGGLVGRVGVVSTHAPLWGATRSRAFPTGRRSCFNPRAPMGRDCRFMHNSESNCMIYAIFKLPQNPPSNHRPEMTRFMREPHVWIPIAWGSRTSRSRAPKLIVNLEFTQVHYRTSKNVRARITQKEATPAHRLPYQHGIPNPIPLRPFGHGATAPRRPYCT